MNESFVKVLFFGGFSYLIYKLLTKNSCEEDVGISDKLGKTEKDFPSEKIEAGTNVEMEHTENRDRAKKIALDHLTEDIDYYEKLATIEKKNPKNKGKHEKEKKKAKPSKNN